MQMDTLQTYDELPYDSLPLPETQPDFLAAMAVLHGYESPTSGRMRVLELGCASGGNLIPLAFHHPESDFVGIELSRLQAEAGARFVAELGLGNVRIVHGDLATLPAGLGRFDYIIAHGVFSWVPPAVQQALLRACREYLTPNGLAYISFNVAAGWQKWLPLRERLLAATEADLPAPQRLAQAVAVLTQLETDFDDAVLLQEIAHLKTAAPSYLFHEYLAEHNAPMAFADFVGQLANERLQYVAEVGPRRAMVELENAWGLAPAAITLRWMEAECALDEVVQTRFRRALISRNDAPQATPAQSTRLLALAFYSDLTSEAEIDLDTTCEQEFINAAGNRFSVAHPLLKAALMALSAAYPAALPYPELIQNAEACMTYFTASGSRDETEFRDALFNLVLVQGVQVTLERRAHADAFESPPRAHALARLQAATPGWVVSGVRQVALGLDAPGRALLAMLDGTQTLDQITQAMQAMLQASGVDMGVETVNQLIQQKIELFERQGLLQATSAKP
jgi:SAM-dependent methyltransferase